MDDRRIDFYRTQDDKCPAREFLDTLPAKTAQKVIWVLKLIQELESVPSSYLKKLEGTDDIWECRVQFGSNIYRFLGFFFQKGVFILTHGFSKKSQKTPQSEIDSHGLMPQGLVLIQA